MGGRVNKIRQLADRFPDLNLERLVHVWLEQEHLSRPEVAERIGTAVREWVTQHEPDAQDELDKLLPLDGQTVGRFLTSPREEKTQKAAVAADKRRGARAIRATFDTIAAIDANYKLLGEQVEALKAKAEKQRLSEKDPVLLDVDDLVKLITAQARYLTLAIHVQDRLHTHEQVHGALQAILHAVSAEVDPATLRRIVERIRSDPRARVLMEMAQGGGNG